MDTDMMWIAFEGVWSFIWGGKFTICRVGVGEKDNNVGWVGLGWVTTAHTMVLHAT